MNEEETKLVEAVRSLARERFAARAGDYDREGAFVHENVEDLKALGVQAVCLKPEWGGRGVSAECQTRIVEEVAYGDGSTAVALNMHLLGADGIAFMPSWPHRDAVLSDIGRNGALVCGPISVPTGELDNRGTGFRFTADGDDLIGNGKAGFASMSDGASYVIVGGLLNKEEGEEPDAVFSLPRIGTPGLNILGNWNAMGLRGTASHDVVVQDMRIPRNEALVIPSAMLRALREGGASPGLTQDRSKGALGILAIWLGLSQAAFDFTTNYLGARIGVFAGTSALAAGGASARSEQAWAQAAVGNMEHWLETGRIVLYDAVRRLQTPFESPAEFTRMLVRTVYHLRRMAEEVAMGSMKVCGAHAYVKARALERIFRDLMGCVVMAWKTDELVQTLGAGALGHPITITGPGAG